MVTATANALTLLQPAVANISWTIGTTHVVSWTDNLNENVQVWLYTPTIGGVVGGWNEISPAGGVAGTTWDWTISTSLTASTGYKIRVVSEDYSTVYNEGVAFELTDATAGGDVYEVFQPVASSNWKMGNQYLISWRDDLAETVNVYYMKSGASQLPISTGVTGSTLLWTVPTTGGFEGTYTIIVESSEDATVEAVSASFTISKTVGSVTAIYQPTTTTSWTVETTHLISWGDNLTEAVDVFYKIGGTEYSIQSNVTGTTCYWTIDAVGTNGIAAGTNNCTVIVRSTDDGSVELESDPFDLTLSSGTAVTVVQPSISGLNWAYNTTHLISWDDDFPENVKIELVSYTNAAATTGEIVLGTPIQASIASSTYVWDIDATSAGYDPALYYKVKITSVNDDNITDMSDNTFTINSTAGTYVDVLSPDGGEYWMAGTSHLISWIDDLPENVKINLYLYTAPSTYTKVDGAGLTDGTTYSGSTMTWTIPQSVDAASNYRVGIKSTLDTTIVNYSAANFDIVPYGKSSKSNVNLDLVKVYPNPASGSVNILAPANISNVEVRNLLGQVVYTNTMEASQATIDVSSFDTGIYVVNISIEGNVVTKKLFVQ